MPVLFAENFRSRHLIPTTNGQMKFAFSCENPNWKMQKRLDGRECQFAIATFSFDESEVRGICFLHVLTLRRGQGLALKDTRTLQCGKPN